MVEGEVDPKQQYDGPLAQNIGEWAAQVLNPYLKAHPQSLLTDSKQIHDPIGKVVELQPWEVFILDSPLMQRLRLIRQLGVGHLLFPTSGYSRFEHSVGALQTATEMFDSIVTNHATRSAARKVEDEEGFKRLRTIVRLAALLHDIGHCVFSHVSEKHYGRTPEVEKAVKFFSRYYSNKVSPAEVNALLIIKCAKFQDLLRAARIPGFMYKESELADIVCNCIAGSTLRTQPNCFIAELINGPVDCDKLDYLARDAHMAGVPVTLDTIRLLSKLRLATIERKGEPPRHSLAIVPSGVRALDELLVSRIFLFDKFYYHAKVMAAEELLRRALYQLAKAIPAFAEPPTLLRYGDDELVAMTADVLALRYGVSSDNPDIQRACDTFSRFKARDLPKRVFAFASRYLPEVPQPIALLESQGDSTTISESSLVYRELRNLVRYLEDQGAKENFVQLIESSARELGSTTDVFVGIQSAQRATGSVYLPVLLPDETIDESPSFLFKTGVWTEAYALNKQTSFVFSSGDRAKIHLAVERLLLESGEFTFAPNCWDMAKLSRTALADARANLPPEWRAYRLPPTFLKEEKTVGRIQAQRERFASFLNALHPVFGPQLVEAWVWQFPDADLQDSALHLLEHITYVEPVEVVTGVMALLEREPDLAKGIWVPLRAQGGPGKSADQLMVDLKELPVEMRPMSALVAEQVQKAGKIVFFDDSLNSGVQCSCLISSWFGVDGLCENPNDSDPDGTRPADLLDAIKRAEVSFVFHSTHPLGRERLETTCSKVGVAPKGISGTLDASHEKYRLKGLRCDSPASRERFVDFLQRQGQAMLKPKGSADERAWSDDQIKDFALGYSGIDLTLVYRHSISTSTPVALWKLSSTMPNYWLPLFPRKKQALLKALQPKRASADAPDYPA